VFIDVLMSLDIRIKTLSLFCVCEKRLGGKVGGFVEL